MTGNPETTGVRRATSGWPTIAPEFQLYSRMRSLIRRSCAKADIKQGDPMATVRISGGVVHDLPADLRTALASDPHARVAWEDISPLARNEWICWTISVKKDQTRRQHVERVCSELKEGMRRPCCWPGCPHR